MIHVVVLESDPPAVLVRFLTRRFIGEYASNASKCFQIVVGDYGGSAAGILVPESSFLPSGSYLCSLREVGVHADLLYPPSINVCSRQNIHNSRFPLGVLFVFPAQLCLLVFYGLNTPQNNARLL